MSPRWLVCLFTFLILPLLSGKDCVVAYYNLENYIRMPRKIDGKMLEDAPKPESEIAALISMICRIRPDILGVVEMGDQSLLLDFQSRLCKAGLELPHIEWVASAEGERHIALLSRFPITASHSRPELPVELDGRIHKSGRGILDVTVKITPDYQLRLVGLHLKSRRTVPEFDEKKFRAREALIVREHLDAIFQSEPSVNLLVFGDLNDTKNESPIKDILGTSGSPSGLKDLPLRDSHGLVWTHFWSKADVYSRIDYLMVSQKLWPAIKLNRSGIGSGREWSKASDHRPLYTTMSVPE